MQGLDHQSMSRYQSCNKYFKMPALRPAPKSHLGDASISQRIITTYHGNLLNLRRRWWINPKGAPKLWVILELTNDPIKLVRSQSRDQTTQSTILTN